MSPIPIPASHRAPPLRLERIVAQDARNVVADVQVAILNTLAAEPLELDGDVQVLAVTLQYLAHAHGLSVDAMAMRAVASATRCGSMQ